MDSKVSGGCLCGGVQYEYTSKPVAIINCHCTMCRKAIGASYGTFIHLPLAGLKFLKDETMKIYESSENVKRHFCGNCGCSIMDVTTYDKEHVGLTGGSVTGDPGVTNQCHIFTNYKVPWVKIDNDQPSCGELELIDAAIMEKK